MAADWPESPITRRTARGVAHHVEALDDRAAAVRAQQGGQDADGGRLAGAVGSEDAEHRAARNRQVDPAQRAHVAERLGQALDMIAWPELASATTVSSSE